MIRTNALVESRRPCPLLATARLWLALGVLAVLLVPAARGTHVLIGWLPFWLVLAPAATLAGLRMLRKPGWPFDAMRRTSARWRRARPQALSRRRSAQEKCSQTAAGRVSP